MERVGRVSGGRGNYPGISEKPLFGDPAGSGDRCCEMSQRQALENVDDSEKLYGNDAQNAGVRSSGGKYPQKRAVLLGESTYGKGSVQSIIPLKNRGAIRLTVSKYYLPSGKSISEVGVIPDIRVEEEGEEFSINTETDNQLNYALKLISG